MDIDEKIAGLKRIEEKIEELKAKRAAAIEWIVARGGRLDGETTSVSVTTVQRATVLKRHIDDLLKEGVVLHEKVKVSKSYSCSIDDVEEIREWAGEEAVRVNATHKLNFEK